MGHTLYINGNAVRIYMHAHNQWLKLIDEMVCGAFHRLSRWIKSIKAALNNFFDNSKLPDYLG